MNDMAIMQYVSYHFHTAVRKHSLDKTQLANFTGLHNFADSIFTHPEVQEFIFSQLNEKIPQLVQIGLSIVYAVVVIPDALFIVGPVCFDQSILLKKQLKISQDFLNWEEKLESCDLGEFIKDVLLLRNLYHEDILTEKEIAESNFITQKQMHDVHKNFVQIVFKNLEEGEHHNPYDQELRELNSIEQGDLVQLQKSVEEDYTGQLGVLAKTRLRNIKNLAIVVISSASRAAMRGGLAPEIAFSLSDSYIQKIETLNNDEDLKYLVRSAEFQYAGMVRDLKKRNGNENTKNKNPKVYRCREYIISHLYEKLTVQTIALAIGVNADYLSDLFFNQEKISITDFIYNEKVNLAKNMLLYTTYSCIDISEYLAFASQSHFGKRFKQLTGFTPKEYRNRYGKKEINES